MNIFSRSPYLSEVDPEYWTDVQLAVDLLSMIRGNKRLGLDFDFKELTAHEHEMVSYLSAQIDSLGSKGK